LNSAEFQAQFIARHEQQVAMRTIGLQMGIFSRQRQGVYTEALGNTRERSGFQVTVQVPNNQGQMVDVQQPIYATPEAVAAISQAEGASDPSDLGQRMVELLKFIGTEAKMNKVALNPDSWFVNMLGNIMGLVQSGDLLTLGGWSNIARAIRLHQDGYGKPGDVINVAREQIQDQRRQLLARLTAAGVATSGLEMADIEAALDNRVKQFIDTHDAWNTAAGATRGAILGNGIGRPFGWIGQSVGVAVGAAAGARLGNRAIQADAEAGRRMDHWQPGSV